MEHIFDLGENSLKTVPSSHPKSPISWVVRVRREDGGREESTSWTAYKGQERIFGELKYMTGRAVGTRVPPARDGGPRRLQSTRIERASASRRRSGR
jgi:hypothetical protein